MEKIKASEVLAMNESLTIEELKGFKFFAVDKYGDNCVYEKEPVCGELYWTNGGNYEVLVTILSNFWHSELDWKNSLREIDFSEYEPTEDEIKHAMGCMRDPIEDISLYPLFDHLDNEHGLVLTEEQLYEIVLLAKKIKLPHEENL